MNRGVTLSVLEGPSSVLAPQWLPDVALIVLDVPVFLQCTPSPELFQDLQSIPLSATFMSD